MTSRERGSAPAPTAGAVYVFGVLGGWAYFWPEADGFWGHVWSIVEGIAWPAYLVYRLLTGYAG